MRWFWGRGGRKLRKLSGAWRSLVAHLLWEQRVGGSNPSAPTILPRWLKPECLDGIDAPVAQPDRASAF